MEDRQFGWDLAFQGWLQLVFFSAVAVAGVVWILADDTMRIGAGEVRLFSDSTAPVLDVAKMITVTSMTFFVYLNLMFILRERRPERPRRSQWIRTVVVSHGGRDSP